jgi:hypothetical protein
MTTFDFDRAFCTYLGGDPDSGVIQIGGGDERLLAEYGEEAATTKQVLDKVLDASIARFAEGFTGAGQTISSWLAEEVPRLSVVTRTKIEARVIYHFQH